MCVCPSVCLWLLQSQITLDPMARLRSNFQGPLNSFQVIFGRVIWTQRPSTISSQGFGAWRLCHTFSGRVGQGQTNVGSGILIFSPQPKKRELEGGAGKGWFKCFGILTFFIKGTTSKIRHWLLLVLCSFSIWCTPKVPRGTPWAQQGAN